MPLFALKADISVIIAKKHPSVVHYRRRLAATSSVIPKPDAQGQKVPKLEEVFSLLPTLYF
jgi:hypothetical protein